MRVCIVYDCLFPHTVGGAERWYRALALRLAVEGHEVTYVTLRQWDRGEKPELPGVELVAAGPRLGLYVPDGRRRIVPPLVFGAGTLLPPPASRPRYDVIHTASFPYFSLLAIALTRPLHRARLVVDWFEVWTRDYWTGYLGRLGGAIGHRVQRSCARIHQHAFCFSRLHADRLRAEGVRSEIHVLEGAYDGSLRTAATGPVAAEPVVVFAGRLIPEKRAPALVPAIEAARQRVPELRCEIFGDGPERSEVERQVTARGLGTVIDVPGFVETARIASALRRALCMALPSSREGYGLIVIEAASHRRAERRRRRARQRRDGARRGRGERRRRPDRVPPGRWPTAILRVHEAGPAMRASTAEWFARNARRLSLESSLDSVTAAYTADHLG